MWQIVFPLTTSHRNAHTMNLFSDFFATPNTISDNTLHLLTSPTNATTSGFGQGTTPQQISMAGFNIGSKWVDCHDLIDQSLRLSVFCSFNQVTASNQSQTSFIAQSVRACCHSSLMSLIPSLQDTTTATYSHAQVLSIIWNLSDQQLRQSSNYAYIRTIECPQSSNDNFYNCNGTGGMGQRYFIYLFIS